MKEERLDRAGKPVPPPKPAGSATLLVLSGLGVAALVLTRHWRR